MSRPDWVPVGDARNVDYPERRPFEQKSGIARRDYYREHRDASLRRELARAQRDDDWPNRQAPEAT